MKTAAVTAFAALVVPLCAACGSDAPAARVAGPVRGAPIDSAPGPPPELAPQEAEPAPAAAEPAPDPGPEEPSLADAGGAEDAPAESAPSAVPSGHLPGAHTQLAAEEKGERKGPKVVGDTTILTFVDLSLGTYDPLAAALGGKGAEKDEKKESELPDEIRALDGKKVAIDGFMIPMDIEEDAVRSFLLTRFPPGCCFGMMPAMDQWVDVEMMNDEGAEHVAMRIVRVTGELEVGELFDDYGYLTSVYRMKGERIASQW